MLDPVKVVTTPNPYQVHRGFAVEDINSDSITLLVGLPELQPNAPYGTVAAGLGSGNINLQDRDGKPITSKFTTANHVVATWEGSSNQRYAPQIRKGEPVEVYRLHDQDKYYWRSTGRGRNYRTTDRLHFEVSATDPTKPGGAKDDTNTYSAYLDSINKKVGIKTSNVNGEACAMVLEADLAAGTFYFSDNSNDPGNRIYLDTGVKSGVPVFQVNLSSGSTLKMQGKDAFVKVIGKFEINAGERFVVNSPITVFNLSQSGQFIINAANIALNTAKDIVLTAGGIIGLNAVSAKIGGVLIAGAARIMNAVKGPYGSSYNPVKISNPEESSPTTANNSPDVAVTFPPYRSP